MFMRGGEVSIFFAFRPSSCPPPPPGAPACGAWRAPRAPTPTSASSHSGPSLKYVHRRTTERSRYYDTRLSTPRDTGVWRLATRTIKYRATVL